MICTILFSFIFFFFNDTATTEIYTLSLHDALPICPPPPFAYQRPTHAARAWTPSVRTLPLRAPAPDLTCRPRCPRPARSEEHTSELQSRNISYAVFCLKKKKNIKLERFTNYINIVH